MPCRRKALGLPAGPVDLETVMRLLEAGSFKPQGPGGGGGGARYQAMGQQPAVRLTGEEFGKNLRARIDGTAAADGTSAPAPAATQRADAPASAVPAETPAPSPSTAPRSRSLPSRNLSHARASPHRPVNRRSRS